MTSSPSSSLHLRPRSGWGVVPSPVTKLYFSSSLEEEALNHRRFLQTRHSRLHAPPSPLSSTLSSSSLLSTVAPHLGLDLDLMYSAFGLSVPPLSSLSSLPLPSVPSASALSSTALGTAAALQKHVLRNPAFLRFVPVVKKFVLPTVDTKTLFAFLRVGTFMYNLVGGTWAVAPAEVLCGV